MYWIQLWTKLIEQASASSAPWGEAGEPSSVLRMNGFWLMNPVRSHCFAFWLTEYDLVSLIHFNVTLKYDQITWRMTHRKATLIKWFIKLNYTWLWFHMNSLSNGFEHQMFTSSIPSLDRHPAARAANPYHGMAPQPKDLDDQEIANAWRFEVWSLEHRRMPTHCSWSIVYVSDLW